MDSLKPQEKSSVCFDKHYISNDPNTRQLKHQKINNVQRSVTNEQQRLSGNSGHYATIQDSSNENTLFTPKPGYHNATPAKRESSSDLYVSFNTGDRLPTSPNNERTPGYSYATNGEIHFLRDSNNENHQSNGTDDSTDTYLEPNSRRIGKSGNDTNHSDIKISWLSETHVYREPDNGLWGTLTSTNDVCRVSSNKIVTAPYKKEKKLCNTCKIITCVNLVLLYTAATAYIVAVLMIGQENGSCKPVVCEDNPVVQNGLVNVINSTAILQCDPGFMANTTVNFQCMSNGSWISDSEAACVLRPCGPYKLSDNVEVSEDLSLINKSITLRCAEGFHFKNESENQIKCVDNKWIGTPECVKPVKETTASTPYVQGDDVSVVCKGHIGKDECEKKLVDICVRIFWDEKTSKDITPFIGVTNSSHCQDEVLVNASFVITNDMHGAELQCIARGDDGSRDKKSILLNVTTTKIQISSSASTVAIGEYFNISTELTYIQGWSTLELRKKNCSGAEITIVSIQKNDTSSNLTIEEHIDLKDKIDIDINDTTALARLTFQFQNVVCSDVCWSGGDIEYISSVKIGDSWVMESESVEFKMNPSVPVLTLKQVNLTNGQKAILTCSGNIGIPSYKMRIREDKLFLILPCSSSEIKLNPETCEKLETITHEFEVKDEMKDRRYQCVIILTNGTTLESNEEILKDTDSSTADRNGNASPSSAAQTNFKS